MFKIMIGTHNSMSYLPPKKWYLTPFKFIAKCQNLSIDEQLNKGIRLFDIRISYDSNLMPEFRHGSMAFKGNVECILNSLNNFKEPIYVRLLLETSKYNSDKLKDKYFKLDCAKWEHIYPNIRFFCGRRKYDWKQLYKFKLDDIDVIQYVASIKGNILDSLYPKLYAKRNNKKHYINNSASYSLFDFIEYAVE